VPTTISATSNTQMSATTGAPVPQPPAVLVVDQFGTGLQGATVSFAVIEGGGVISPATVTTDGEGKARATSWTLGLAGGSNKVTATVGTLPPLEFAASGLVLNVSTPIVTVSRPELSVNVAQSAATIVAGTSQTYTVKVHNRGSGTTNSIVLRNALPADLNFVSSGATRGFICSRSGTTLSCTSGTISGGDSATIRLVTSIRHNRVTRLFTARQWTPRTQSQNRTKQTIPREQSLPPQRPRDSVKNGLPFTVSSM
jgi:uncharacterized repeat protein (TIGR01451 family)